MLYNKIMFDLDGTLIHSMPGIFHALRAMIAEMGLPERDDAYLRNLVGPPFQLGFPRFLDIHGGDIDRAFAIYMRHARDILSIPGMIEPYPGVLDMLKTLSQAGLLLGVVTSKGAGPAQKQMEHFGFLPYLSFTATGDDSGHGDKNALLQSACEALGRDGMVMVGDRFYDLDAAHACGVDSVAVLYGYGAEEEIRACRPTHSVATVAELQALLLHTS